MIFKFFCSCRWLGVRLQLMGAVIVLGVALLAVFKRFEYSAALAGLTLSYTLNVSFSTFYINISECSKTFK